jgi:16S rRNA (guanine966-N2)-methyltransferase
MKRSFGELRIISGALRGRRWPVPDVPGLRPTPDRVRETLFNWLAPYIAGRRVLDLFAGSGALAFEALSRGAAAATLVEQNRAAQLVLRATADRFGLTQVRVEGGGCWRRRCACSASAARWRPMATATSSCRWAPHCRRCRRTG